MCSLDKLLKKNGIKDCKKPNDAQLQMESIEELRAIIEDQDSALVELASIISDQDSALVELASIVSELM